MTPTAFLTRKTGLSPAALFGGAAPLVRVEQGADGTMSFPVWAVPGVAAPTADEVADALAAADPEPDLATAQATQNALLRTACKLAIIGGGGFASSALGAVHGYPTDPDSKENLIGSVLDSVVPGLPDGWTTPFWCADLSGKWALVDHTAAQIQEVGRDSKAAVVAAQQKYAGLLTQVAAATTVADVQAVAWA